MGPGGRALQAPGLHPHQQLCPGRGAALLGAEAGVLGEKPSLLSPTCGFLGSPRICRRTSRCFTSQHLAPGPRRPFPHPGPQAVPVQPPGAQGSQVGECGTLGASSRPAAAPGRVLRPRRAHPCRPGSPPRFPARRSVETPGPLRLLPAGRASPLPAPKSSAGSGSAEAWPPAEGTNSPRTAPWCTPRGTGLRRPTVGAEAAASASSMPQPSEAEARTGSACHLHGKGVGLAQPAPACPRPSPSPALAAGRSPTPHLHRGICPRWGRFYTQTLTQEPLAHVNC